MSPRERLRTRVSRVPDRADYDIATVASILDAATVCHVGLAEDDGYPIAAKVRTGGPVDEPEDYELPVWAGTIPLRTVAGEALPDEGLPDGLAEPPYVGEYRQARS